LADSHQEMCSLCRGTGKSPSLETIPNYGFTPDPNTTACEVCGSYAGGHVHKTCPSCGGTGYTTRFVPTPYTPPVVISPPYSSPPSPPVTNAHTYVGVSNGVPNGLTAVVVALGPKIIVQQGNRTKHFTLSATQTDPTRTFFVSADGWALLVTNNLQVMTIMSPAPSVRYFFVLSR
jgi:hypothetical protein